MSVTYISANGYALPQMLIYAKSYPNYRLTDNPPSTWEIAYNEDGEYSYILCSNLPYLMM